MKYLVGNWKMNPSNKEEAVSLAQYIEAGLKSDVSDTEVVLCPPFLYLFPVRMVLERCRLGAQDVAAFARGAYTGEVSAVQLYNMNVGYCIIGHSERRKNNKEDDADTNIKVKMSVQNKIMPVLCLGGGLAPEDGDAKIKSVLRRQFEAGIKDNDVEKIIVAYEPTWAISSVGHGRMPEAGHVREMANFIRSLAKEDHVKEIIVLYGGNVNSANAAEYINDVDGYLIGSASLNADEFLRIIYQVSQRV